MNAIVIMAKAPLPDKVKTRLIPPLNPETASRLYHNFLLDKIEQVRSIGEAYPFIAYTPGSAEAFFRSILPSGFDLIRQTGADLGERLANVSGSLFERGFKKVVLLDSDTPNLPPEYIREGLARLDDVDVVLGPCEDGGYYLIGMRTSQPSLFKGIPWSTPGVTEVTLKKARASGLSVSLLDKWYDVDTVEELLRLKKDLSSLTKDQRSGFFCENTYHFICGISIERDSIEEDESIIKRRNSIKDRD